MRNDAALREAITIINGMHPDADFNMRNWDECICGRLVPYIAFQDLAEQLKAARPVQWFTVIQNYFGLNNKELDVLFGARIKGGETMLDKTGAIQIITDVLNNRYPSDI